jgi:hypothetical protein
LLFNKDERAAQDKLGKKDKWFSKWYGTVGRHGRMLAEINAMLNSIPNRSLGGISSADFMEALLGSPDDDDEKETWKQMVNTADATMVKSAEKRRKASTDKPFTVGDWVRTVNKPYLKADMRGNYLKFNPRWSVNVFRIRRRAGGESNAPFRYQIEQIDVQNPAAATTSTRPEQKIWHSQSELLLIPKVAPKQAPHDLMVSERPWENEKIELARKNDLAARSQEPQYFKSYPFAEFE